MMALCMMQTASAQSSVDKKTVDKVRKMVMGKVRRTPAPLFMTGDNEAYLLALDIRVESDYSKHQLSLDSAKARTLENELIAQHVDQTAVKAEVVKAVKDSIHREKLRYDYVLDQIENKRKAAECQARKAPGGELVYLEYDFSGMAYNPAMPVVLEREKNDSVSVLSGRSKVKWMMPLEVMQRVSKVFLDNQLYKLQPGYYFEKVPLPDIPETFLLDAPHWRLDARFSDGTEISSSGEMHISEVGPIEKILMDIVKETRQKYNLPPW